MTEFSGSFTAHVRVLSVLSLADALQHELQMVEVGGPQSSTDENWNSAVVTYWAVTDLVAGNGTQRGYYVNQRPDGGRDWGTFEGKASSEQGQIIVEGTWRGTDGSGRFAGLKSQGKYMTRLISPTEVQCTWQEQYELATIAQAA